MQAPIVLTSLFLLDPYSLMSSRVSSRELSLEVSDDASGYNTEEGDGAWVKEYLGWIRVLWHNLTNEDIQWASFSFFDDQTFRDTLTAAYHRNLFVEFTNRYYVEWRENQIHIPSIDDVDSNVQDHLCAECDNDEVWEEEYDMSLAPIDPCNWNGWEHIPSRATVAEQRLIEARNAALRVHMDEAWADWVENRRSIGRTNICDNRCDAFYDRQCESMRRMVDFNIHWLDAKWQAFVGATIQLPPIPHPLHVLPMADLEIEPAVVEPIRPLSVVAREARRARRGW